MQSTLDVVSTAGKAFNWILTALIGLNFVAIFVTMLALVERQGAADFPVIPPAPDWGVFLLVGLFLVAGVLTAIGAVGGMVASGTNAMSAYREYK